MEKLGVLPSRVTCLQVSSGAHSVLHVRYSSVSAFSTWSLGFVAASSASSVVLRTFLVSYLYTGYVGSYFIVFFHLPEAMDS